jgi:hypothetical protein
MVVVAVTDPEVPVMVTVLAPAVAVLPAVSVSTLLPVVGLVANAAVTPLGSPEAARVTLPVNPPLSVTVIVSVAVEPWVTDNELAEGASVKLPVAAAVTVRAMVVVAGGNAPEVPVMVTVEFPAGAVALAVRVSTLDPVAGLVLKEAVTPLGRPDAARVTLPVNPPASVTEMVSAPLLPWAIDSAGVEAAIVKLGEGDPPSGNWILSSKDCFNELTGVAS